MSFTPLGRTPAPSPRLDALRWSSDVRTRPTGKRRLAVVLAVILGALAVVTVLNRLGPGGTGLVVEPLVAVALLGLARWHGLTWHDLGLSRRTWLSGAKWAGLAIGAVTVVYVTGALLPLTRSAFDDSRYQLGVGTALLTGFVLIPLGTILLEEVAFRGVLMGVLRQRRGVALAISVSSVLFGLWHVLPSLAMGANRLVASVVGEGLVARLIMIAAVVAFTGTAGWLLCEVRRRSGSLLAPMGLHWATNGLGVLLASALWSLRVV